MTKTLSAEVVPTSLDPELFAAMSKVVQQVLEQRNDRAVEAEASAATKEVRPERPALRRLYDVRGAARDQLTIHAICDNDNAGHQWAERLHELLAEHGHTPVVMTPPTPGADLTDWAQQEPGWATELDVAVPRTATDVDLLGLPKPIASTGSASKTESNQILGAGEEVVYGRTSGAAGSGGVAG